MVNEQQFIAELKELSQLTATEGLKRPARKDSFEYGELSGKVQGLMMAEELFLRLLRGEEKGGKQRAKPRNAYTSGLPDA